MITRPVKAISLLSITFFFQSSHLPLPQLTYANTPNPTTGLVDVEMR